jgi:undecaprenyl diphosphate synthase
MTANNTNMVMVFAFNYGSRHEIAEAAKALAGEVAAGDLDPASIDEAALAGRVGIPEMPDPDLVIRTSGEFRTSNYLLWQTAYSEFVFTETLWPDFRTENLLACIEEYRRRDRRYGGVEQPPS